MSRSTKRALPAGWGGVVESTGDSPVATDRPQRHQTPLRVAGTQSLATTIEGIYNVEFMHHLGLLRMDVAANASITFFASITITVGGIPAEVQGSVLETSPGLFRLYLRPAQPELRFFEGVSPDGRPRLEHCADGSWRELRPADEWERTITLRQGDETFARCILLR